MILVGKYGFNTLTSHKGCVKAITTEIGKKMSPCSVINIWRRCLLSPDLFRVELQRGEITKYKILRTVYLTDLEATL